MDLTQLGIEPSDLLIKGCIDDLSIFNTLFGKGLELSLQTQSDGEGIFAGLLGRGTMDSATIYEAINGRTVNSALKRLGCNLLKIKDDGIEEYDGFESNLNVFLLLGQGNKAFISLEPGTSIQIQGRQLTRDITNNGDDVLHTINYLNVYDFPEYDKRVTIFNRLRELESEFPRGIDNTSTNEAKFSRMLQLIQLARNWYVKPSGIQL